MQVIRIDRRFLGDHVHRWTGNPCLLSRSERTLYNGLEWLIALRRAPVYTIMCNNQPIGYVVLPLQYLFVYGIQLFK